MAHKGPHISISPDYVVNRILRINIDDFAEWPESVRHLAIAIAEELFLVAYNPFINVETVRNSVHARFERESMALAHYFANAIGEGITMFWSAYEAERSFREELISALRNILPNECILSSPSALVASATDATDLRMELPLLVVEPDSAEQVAALVKLANDMKFALIPRGGGSGMTGGAVPARKRTVIVSLTRLTKIGPIDLENMTVTVEAGAITQNVIKAVDAAGALFSVDPASKQASSIGGNVSENAGGPSAFEYGTTLDNLLWWRMVTPTGEIISVERENHPRHKILPEETAVFVVKDISGGVRNVIHLRGDEIRLPGLGKDVTNKALGGLPGMQKEGVDGIITEACGRSMHPAAVVVRELVGLRNRIRQEGDYAHLSALEEFNAKYVQAIEYKRKSQKYEGLPISVIILQVDGDDPYLLDKCVNDIVCVVEEQTRKANASGKTGTACRPSPSAPPASSSTRTWSSPWTASRTSPSSSNSSTWNARPRPTATPCRKWAACPASPWKTRNSTASSPLPPRWRPATTRRPSFPIPSSGSAPRPFWPAWARSTPIWTRRSARSAITWKPAASWWPATCMPVTATAM